MTILRRHEGYVEPYLRQILAFIGIEDIQTVRAEGMNIPPLAILAIPNGGKYGTCVEAVSPQRTMGFTLRTVIRPVTIGIGWIEPAKRCRICIDLLPGVGKLPLGSAEGSYVWKARDPSDCPLHILQPFR